jgi:hypothetical protein
MSGAVGPPTSPEWTAIVRAQENARGDTQEAFREIAPKFVLPENINDETEYPRGLRYQSIMMATYKGALGRNMEHHLRALKPSYINFPTVLHPSPTITYF